MESLWSQGLELTSSGEPLEPRARTYLEWESLWSQGLELIWSGEPVGPKQTIEFIWHLNLSDLNLSSAFEQRKRRFWPRHEEPLNLFSVWTQKTDIKKRKQQFIITKLCASVSLEHVTYYAPLVRNFKFLYVKLCIFMKYIFFIFHANSGACWSATCAGRDQGWAGALFDSTRVPEHPRLQTGSEVRLSCCCLTSVWWWLFPPMQGFGEIVPQFIPRLRFFFFFKWRFFFSSGN